MMLDHLRHTLIYISVGFLLISCSSDEPDMSACEMKFDISSVSRSKVTTASNITESPFTVFGNMVPSQLASDPSARTTIYNNTPVTFFNSSWTAEETHYWFYDHEHSFVAVHPASAIVKNGANLQYSDALSFSYTLPTDLTQTSDILAATHRRKYIDRREYDENGTLIGGEADPVYFRFGHVMSQINISPSLYDNTMNDEGYVQFHKIELSGLKSKATINIIPALLQTSSQTDDRVVDVTGQEVERSYIIEFPQPKKVVNGQGYMHLFDDSDAIIVLPQTFAADSEAEIILSYTVYDHPKVEQIILPLSSLMLESGKSYNYKFTIDRTGLLFGTMTITDWDVLNAGDIDLY